MKILLTGGNGFIGQHILLRLLQNNHQVIAPSRKNFNPSLKIMYHNFHPENVLFYNTTFLDNYRGMEIDVIIHLAAVRGEGQGSISDYERVNVLGCGKLIDFALEQKVKRFIYISTVGIYGTIPAQLPADLNTKPMPDNTYHLSKYQAEVLIKNKLTHVLPLVIIRPTITYGLGDNGFLVKLIQLVKRKLFPLIQKEVYIHLVDVKMIVHLINDLLNTEKHEDYDLIVADKSPIKLNELVDIIYQHFFSQAYPKYLKVPPYVYIWGEKLSKLFNWNSINTSFKLLSQSWYYDIRELQEKFVIPLTDTLDGIKLYLQAQYPQIKTRTGNE